jgi:hypothetical protein
VVTLAREGPNTEVSIELIFTHLIETGYARPDYRDKSILEIGFKTVNLIGLTDRNKSL